MSDPEIISVEWSIHSIITMDGKPYVVMQEWAMWFTEQTYQGGSRALAPMPTGGIRLDPLINVISKSNKRRITEDLLCQ